MNKLTEDINIIKKRFNELSIRSQNRGVYFYSDFLNLYEQTILFNEIKRDVTLYGGFSEAERKIACFGNENEFGYEPYPPIKIICIKPLSKKFSDDLTHRDFLATYKALLKEDGILRLKTDNVGLFDFSLEEFEAMGLEMSDLTRDLHNSPYKAGNIMTEYEMLFSEQGQPIYRCEAMYKTL